MEDTKTPPTAGVPENTAVPEPEVPSGGNSIKDRFLHMGKNTRLVLLGVVAIIVIILVVSANMIMSNNVVTTNNPTPTPQITSSPTQGAEPTADPTVTELIRLQGTPTPTPTALPDDNNPEKAVIKTQVNPQIDAVSEAPYQISRIKLYGSDWAIVQITNPTTDPASVIVHKVNGTWNLILGPGTYFDETELQEFGVPQEVGDAANAGI